MRSSPHPVIVMAVWSLATILITTLLIIKMLLPHKVPCGSPMFTCAHLNEDGSQTVTYYEIQPHVITRREKKQGTNTPYFYSNGEDRYDR